MKLVTQPRRRHTIRLDGYDYAQEGAYFITVCTQRMMCLFGEIVEGEMRINRRGEIVMECWQAIPNHFPQVELDAFVVMPNHIHGILVINVGATHGSPLRGPSQLHKSSGPNRGSIGAILAQFKAAVSRRIAIELGESNLWQRNYYDRIIRDEVEWGNIRAYIETNPLRWAEDENNPAAIK